MVSGKKSGKNIVILSVVLIFLVVILGVSIYIIFNSENDAILFSQDSNNYSGVNLFSETSKIYLNDSINKVKSVITKSDFPQLLVNGTFNGNVNSDYTQKIYLGDYSHIGFAKGVGNLGDPEFMLKVGTDSDNYVYNFSIEFDDPIDFTDSNSGNKKINLLGDDYWISLETDDDNLMLIKDLDDVFDFYNVNDYLEVSDGSANDYELSLISTTDSSAEFKVIKNSGTEETLTINEGESALINDLFIYLRFSNENGNSQNPSASVILNPFRISLAGATGELSVGSYTLTTISGISTKVVGGTTATKKIIFSFYGINSDYSLIYKGSKFTNFIFDKFSLGFRDLNIDKFDSDRENFEIAFVGSKGLAVTFKDINGNERTIIYVMNLDGKLELQHNSDGKNISVREGEIVKRDEYVVLGNGAKGHLLKVINVTNKTSGFNLDNVTLKDVFSEVIYDSLISDEGIGTLDIDGEVYDVRYFGLDSDESNYVVFNHPDSSGDGGMILYPTLQTSNGAKISFYEPLIFSLDGWANGTTNDITQIKIPNGDGYTEIGAVINGSGTVDSSNWTIGEMDIDTTTIGESTTVAVGKLIYNFTTVGEVNRTRIFLVNPKGGNIVNPALIIFEGEDDNNEHNVLIITSENIGDVGVGDVIRTWSSDTIWDSISFGSNPFKLSEVDLWGTIVTINTFVVDQHMVDISYPTEQVSADLDFYTLIDKSSINGNGDDGNTDDGNADDGNGEDGEADDVCEADFDYAETTVCVNDRTVRYASVVNITGVGCTSENITLPVNQSLFRDCNNNNVIGNGDDVGATNFNPKVYIEDSVLNDTFVYSSNKKLDIDDGNISIISLDFDFSNELNLPNLKIQKNDKLIGKFGYLIVSGLEGYNKTFRVERFNSLSDSVCIKDSTGITDISHISRKCAGSNEINLECDGQNHNGFKCAIRSIEGKDYFVVSGLKNTGVKEILPTNISAVNPPIDPILSLNQSGSNNSSNNSSNVVSNSADDKNLEISGIDGGKTKINNKFENTKIKGKDNKNSKVGLWIVAGVLFMSILIVLIVLLFLIFNKKETPMNDGFGQGIRFGKNMR